MHLPMPTLGPRRLLVAALMALGAGCTSPLAAAPGISDTGSGIVDHSNAFRNRHGLAAVRPDAALARAAQDFADYMARTGRYGHTADGRQPAQRAAAAGYAHCMVAENIAWQFDSRGFTSARLAQALVQGWIDSPPHRHNLLLPEATDIGVAVARSPTSGRWYAVQLLARPATLSTRFEIGNRSRQHVPYTVDGTSFVLAPGVTRRHEQCAVPAVVVALPGLPQPTALRPASGARYRIEALQGRLQIVGG
jgi:uncharacterized protein YkwD